ncbi:CocE/NonD family hydrolase [Sciscionella marina]|uniref:CocE/NonD family hydrolase n=1 Tax=Sciscionella marina TaxID=508770 RepID=UPI00036FD2E6|nr:CocE/NonD family hydrolase [Sciscionella marina]
MGLLRRIGLLATAAALTAGTVATPALAAGGSDWPPQTGRGPCSVSKTDNAGVPMRDGTTLRADVYRPETTKKVPVILYRTQYDKVQAQMSPYRYQSPDWFASHCYLVVTEDIRGQYASNGTFSEFTHDQKDGYDSVEWAARLPGSNGKVGMYGSSYVGATQWLAAETAPPHLKTIIPANTAADYYDNWTYEDGAFRLAFVEPWTMGDLALSAAQNRGDMALADQLKKASGNAQRWLAYRPYTKLPPLRPQDPKVAPYFFDWLRHRTDGPYWQKWAPQRYYHKIGIPVLDFEGWYDAFLPGGIQNFTGMTQSAGSAYARANQHIVIGPWDHVGWGRPQSTEAPLLKQIGPVGNSPINEMMLDWWDHYLKGKDNGIDEQPKVRYFEMGADKWKTAAQWPIPGTRWTDYYLASTGNAGGSGGTLGSAPPARNAADHYRYDPRDPVPSVGGHSCCSATTGPQGPYDQSIVERRPDVLGYTSKPLTKDTEVTGPMTVTLYAKSSAPNTDWTAKVSDVHPDGSAVNLNNGIVRASFRESHTSPTPIVPGKVYRYTIKVWPSSNLFKAGHRIRLDISSSDYPQFDPNPNNGSWAGETDRTTIARQTVLHDAAHPSKLTLPVIR